MDFQHSLKQIQALLQKELAVFFREKRKKVEKIDPELVSIVHQIADLTLRGGKRFRPFLCWLGHEIAKESKACLAGRQARKSKVKTDLASKDYVPRFLLDAMMGLELFHTFALIHDDVIDQDKVRRGGNTIHEYFKVKGKRKNVKGEEARHFGTSMAILAGDLALAWADELMGEVARLSLRAERSNLNFRKIATSSQRNIGTPRNDVGTWRVYQKMKEQVIYGQTLDVMRQFGFSGISREKVNELKTAWYSVVWPLTIGALLASAQHKDILRLQRYGLLVGQAYQLRDDFMDGDIVKEDFATRLQVYKSSAQKAIDAFLIDDQRKKFLSDIAAFVVTRDS